MAGRLSSGNSASKVEPMTWVIFPVAGMQTSLRSFEPEARGENCPVTSGLRIVRIGGDVSREARGCVSFREIRPFETYKRLDFVCGRNSHALPFSASGNSIDRAV